MKVFIFGLVPLELDPKTFLIATFFGLEPNIFGMAKLLGLPLLIDSVGCDLNIFGTSKFLGLDLLLSDLLEPNRLGITKPLGLELIFDGFSLDIL